MRSSDTGDLGQMDVRVGDRAGVEAETDFTMAKANLKPTLEHQSFERSRATQCEQSTLQ